MTAPAAGVTAPGDRLAGPDVVRAVALIGVVVMNYHGYLILQGGGRRADGWWAMVFDPWRGPLGTRFAATFVLVAGVGITLLTRSAIGRPASVTAARWRLVRRGLLLYVVGLIVDGFWPGTILPYYGAMFVIAAGAFTWRTRWIVLAGGVAAVAGAAVEAWRFQRHLDGHSTTWLTDPDRSPRGYLLDVAVNGTHPLLPWLAFLAAGMVLGRVLATAWWRSAALAAGTAMVAFAAVVSIATPGAQGSLHARVVSIHPFDRGLLYVTSALGSALVAYAVVDWIAVRWPGPTDPLRRAGQLTLTLYLAHIVVFVVLVDWLGWIGPAGLDTALVFAAIFWVVAIACAVAWQRRFRRGPAEIAYRAFGG